LEDFALPVVDKPQPKKMTLTELICFQTVDGSWQPASLPHLQVFIKRPLPTKATPPITCTLAALFVLEWLFSDQLDEWKIISRKAK